jgi:acyl-CoA thioester hydrolase
MSNYPWSISLLPLKKEGYMPAKARCQITVRHYECDPLGHVNHAMYVHYFEVGRLTAMADAGLPFSAILKQGYTVVAVDIYVQYKMPAFSDDVLEVESYITDFHGALMTWQQVIHRRADGVLAAVAEVHGAFTRADGRPTRIPSAMRTLLETVYVPDAVPLLPRQRRRPSA